MRGKDRDQSRVLPPAIQPVGGFYSPSDPNRTESFVLPPNLSNDLGVSQLRSVQPSVMVRRGDVCRLTFYSHVSQANLLVTTRVYYNGEIITGTYPVRTNGTLIPQTLTIDMTDGQLIGVYVIWVSGNALTRGNCFVKGEILQGTATQISNLLILSNYVTSGIQVSFPFSPIVSSLDGEGFYNDQLIVGVPLASIQVPVNARWNIDALVIHLHTSAVAGNRAVYVTFQAPSGQPVYVSEPRLVFPANTNIDIFFSQYTESTVAFNDGFNNSFWVNLPKLTLTSFGGLSASVNIALFGADPVGDTVTAVLWNEEFVDVS